MADLFDFEEAKRRATADELADEGAARALAHAAAVHDDWAAHAYAALIGFARRTPTFMIEDVRAAAAQIGLPSAPSARAWGAITLRASRDGVIVRDSYRKTSNPSAHGTPATLWRSLICSEAA